MTELEQKAEEYCRQDDLGHFIRTTEEVKQAYIDGAIEAEKTWEQERDLMWKRIDKYKKDLKALRVAFIQLQVEALSGTNLSDWMNRLAEELRKEEE